jgi:ubiquinone/menaquinone biosynthesis C-methylase UbiE
VKDRYSFIAPFYSSLAKLVFGDDLRYSKTFFIEELNQKRVLILGGGDGLDYGDFQAELAGEYWELSDAMLKKAKKNLSESKLEFHLGHFHPDPGNTFDEVWLHFVLDTFTDYELKKFLFELKSALKSESKLYLADFFEPRSWVQRVIQFMMMHFFRIFTAHPRVDLPKYEQLLKKTGFKKLEDLKKRKGWIRVQIWAHSVN